MEVSILNGYKIKDKKAIRFYDTVQDMKEDDTLKEGMHAKTKGYYAVNDGGASEYHITATESNSDYQEELESGLYANLVIKDFITPEQFGAYGDNTHDDKNAIQKMFDSGYKNILMNKKYYISNSVLIHGSNYKIHGTGSIESDSNNPVLILNLTYSEINLNGSIKGKTCIKFRATENDDTYIQYVTLKNMVLEATDKCVECERTSEKWINELHFENIEFNGAYGFYFMDNYLNTGYRFINCSNEICTTAFIKAYNLSFFDIIGLRNQESWENTLIDIENTCDYFNINTSDPINIEKINLSRTVPVKGEVNACIFDNGGARLGNMARCFNGVFFLVPSSTNGLRLNDTTDTYDYTTNTENLFRTCITLDYVEGGHNYIIKVPNGYYAATEKLLTINNGATANTLTFYTGNTSHSVTFPSSGLFEIINHNGVLFLSKLDKTNIS